MFDEAQARFRSEVDYQGENSDHIDFKPTVLPELNAPRYDAREEQLDKVTGGDDSLHIVLSLSSEEFEARGGETEFLRDLSLYLGLDVSEIHGVSFHFESTLSPSTPQTPTTQ